MRLARQNPVCRAPKSMRPTGKLPGLPLIDPQNVIGRDQLITQTGKMLEKSSVRFTAERRVGKTTVMTKMAAEPHSGFEVL
jgi:hypothetical protein